MNRRFPYAFVGLLALAGGAWFALRAWAGPGADFNPSFQFELAKQAYDAGKMDDAIRVYEDIAAKGLRAPELRFNLGNAYFRKGQLGRAVLNYRAAWRATPRDPDVAANLQFALQTAGAPLPSVPVVRHLLRRLSRAEWAGVAAFAFWLSCALLAWLISRRGGRDAARRLLVGSALLLVVGAVGLLEWWDLDRQPEAVVVAAGQSALFAPLKDSTVHFILPAGSIVRIEERSAGWTKVRLDTRSGWIPDSACLVVPE